MKRLVFNNIPNLSSFLQGVCRGVFVIYRKLNRLSQGKGEMEKYKQKWWIKEMLVKHPCCNLKEDPSIKFNILHYSVCCWIIWLSWQFCLKRQLPLNCKHQYSSVSSCAAIIHQPLRIKTVLNCKLIWCVVSLVFPILNTNFRSLTGPKTIPTSPAPSTSVSNNSLATILVSRVKYHNSAVQMSKGNIG